jgi:hypothetical protein
MNSIKGRLITNGLRTSSAANLALNVDICKKNIVSWFLGALRVFWNSCWPKKHANLLDMNI